MSTFTTKAQFRVKEGLVEPFTKPPFQDPDEVMVTFIKYTKEEDEDPDEALYRQIEPQYRSIRREVFKERYPELYRKYYGSAEESSG